MNTGGGKSKTKEITIALAGNPNSGKTTLFNSLTGSRQRVGNYPGITVETREGYVQKNNSGLHVIDLPGTYSLTAYSEEELAARNVLVQEQPDVVVDVVDATNLERNLYLAVQFLELGIPVVLALNMMDEVKKNRDIVLDTAKLSSHLDVPIVETVARDDQGVEELLSQAVQIAESEKSGSWQPIEISYGPDLDPVLDSMVDLINREDFLTDLYPARWIALKFLEGDQEIINLGRERGGVAFELESIASRTNEHCQKTLNIDPEGIIADYRYGFIISLLKQDVMTRREDSKRWDFTKILDNVLTHRFLGPIIMLGIIYGLFKLTFGVGEVPLGWVEGFFSWLGSSVHDLLPPGLLRSMLVSGVIAGVGGVLSFVPLILIMFLGISFLEDSGYMARMAYMLDRVFRAFGLHGSSVMPFIVSGGIPGGCAVPGVMATRTLRSPKEKLATMITAPFLTCGAKVPVLLLIAGAFFPHQGAELLFIITVFAWCMVLLTSRLLRSTVIRGESTPFVMELPPYRMPTLKGVLIHAWERGWEYIKKAGTIILAISILIWAAMTFPGLPDSDISSFNSREAAIQNKIENAKSKELKSELNSKLHALQNKRAQSRLKHSVAGRIGTFLEPVSQIAGFDWRTNVALTGGFAAKEVIVSSMGTVYSMGEIKAGKSSPLSDKLANDPNFTTLTGISLMVFVMLYAPCFVTVVTMARESSWKWAVFSVVFNTVLAFVLASGIYQIGRLMV